MFGSLKEFAMTPPRPGDHVVDLVDDAIHHLLPPDVEQYVHAHAAVCPICGLAMKEARRRHAALRSLAPSEA